MSDIFKEEVIRDKNTKLVYKVSTELDYVTGIPVTNIIITCTQHEAITHTTLNILKLKINQELKWFNRPFGPYSKNTEDVFPLDCDIATIVNHIKHTLSVFGYDKFGDIDSCHIDKHRNVSNLLKESLYKKELIEIER